MAAKPVVLAFGEAEWRGDAASLARAYKATKNIKGAKAAFIKAKKLDPSVKDEHRALALELLNSL